MLDGAEMAHLAVVGAVMHAALLAPLHQLVLFEAVLSLGLELAECEQAVLLQQEHQVLVHGPLDQVRQDDHELVVEQLLHFGGEPVAHDAREAPPSSFLSLGGSADGSSDVKVIPQLRWLVLLHPQALCSRRCPGEGRIRHSMFPSISWGWLLSLNLKHILVSCFKKERNRL